MAWTFRFLGCGWSVGRCFSNKFPIGVRINRDHWATIYAANVHRWGIVILRMHGKRFRV